MVGVVLMRAEVEGVDVETPSLRLRLHPNLHNSTAIDSSIANNPVIWNI